MIRRLFDSRVVVLTTLIIFLTITFGVSLSFTQFASAESVDTFSVNRSLWSYAADVKSLQRFLNDAGFLVATAGAGSPGSETVLFGLRTFRALSKFQSFMGLPSTGYFSPLTRQLLNNKLAGSTPASPSKISPTEPPEVEKIAIAVATSSTSVPIPISPGYGGGGGGSTIPQTVLSTTDDIVAPVISLIAPLSGANASSTIALTANASDNVGISGVKFYVNGTLVGSEVISPPYTVFWNSTATTSGSKTLFAVARDSAGNLATSSVVSISVDNTAPFISAVSSSTAPASSWIAWLTDETSDSQIEYGLTSAYGSMTALNPAFVTNHSVTITGLVSNTVYHFRIRTTDAAGILATSTDRIFKTGNTDVIMLGDSRAGSNFSNSATTAFRKNISLPAWAAASSGQRFDLPLRNFGVGGNTTGDMLARISAVTADAASNVVVLGGTNDRSQGRTLQYSIDNMTSVIDALGAANKNIYLLTEIPRGGEGGANDLPLADNAIHNQFHQWLRDTACLGRSYCHVVDAWPSLVAADSDPWHPIAGYTYDGLHFQGNGAQVAGSILSVVMNNEFVEQDLSRLPTTNNDGYSSSTNVTGVLVTNPLLTGTAGTKLRGATGFVADGWTLDKTATETNIIFSGSKGTCTAGEEQTISFSGTPNVVGASILFQQSIPVGTLANGNALRGMAHIELNSGAQGVLGVVPFVSVTAGGVTVTARDLDQFQDPYYLTSGFNLPLFTPAASVPSGSITAATAGVRILLHNGTAATGTVRICQAGARKF